MVISVPGEFYIYETNQHPNLEELRAFFQDLNENDILEVRITSPTSQLPLQIYHVAKILLAQEYVINFTDMSLRLSGDVFEQVVRKYPYNLPIPVIDSARNCVSILKKIKTYYDHYYHYEGDLDLDFLNQYDCMVLDRVNEYSVELYKKALPLWSGSEVYLIGSEWRDYISLFPTPTDILVTILENIDALPTLPNDLTENSFPRKITIIEGFQQNEDTSRYNKGILYYDEVMTLTFMFSYVIHPGAANPDKKFFLIDGFFKIEGIYGIWNKVFTAARYAIAKGYLPVFKIVSSDANIYSDYECDDIWNKFFLQPGDYSLEEVEQSHYLALSPNMNILNTLRYIMNKEAHGIQLSWPHGMYNEKVDNYLNQRINRFLPSPERTLGILLRGTDYVKTRLPGHPAHASMEMINEKIIEVEQGWDFDYIYLSTEDEEICEKMKEHYGDRITFTDQERYTTEPGQLLVDLHQQKQEGKGFRLGAEYLCSVELLSRCSSLIASGPCGALGEALRLNDGKYKHLHVFHV